MMQAFCWFVAENFIRVLSFYQGAHAWRLVGAYDSTAASLGTKWLYAPRLDVGATHSGLPAGGSGLCTP